jgi:hypothetical protein
MILLRLSPLIPYNALDYMSGITAIPFWAYTVALIGLLPGTVSLCIVGASASSLTDTSSAENMTLKITTIVLGVVFAAGGIFLVSYYSQRELERVSINHTLSITNINADFVPLLIPSLQIDKRSWQKTAPARNYLQYKMTMTNTLPAMLTWLMAIGMKQSKRDLFMRLEVHQ